MLVDVLWRNAQKSSVDCHLSVSRVWPIWSPVDTGKSTPVHQQDSPLFVWRQLSLPVGVNYLCRFFFSFFSFICCRRR